MVLCLSMIRQVRIKVLNISLDLDRVSDLLKNGNKKEIYIVILDLEYCLDVLTELSVERRLRILLNKFEKEFKMMKIAFFLRGEGKYFSEKALAWANILQHRAKLA